MFAECRNLSDTSAIKNWDRTSLKILFKIANPVHTGIDKYQLKILRPITAGFFDLRMCDKYTKQNLFLGKRMLSELCFFKPIFPVQIP